MTPTRESNACLPAREVSCPAAAIVPQRSWRLALLGPSDVPSPSLTAQLAHALGACALFTGQTFRTARAACACTSAALAELDSCRARGHPIEDGTIMLLLRQSRACLRCKRGFLLEGFPQTLTQARAFDALLAAEHLPLDGVIYYESTVDHPANRLEENRRISDSVTTSPQIAGGVHEQGAAPSKARRRELLAVVQHYRALGLLLTVDASNAASDVFDRTLERLAEREGSTPRPLTERAPFQLTP